MDATDYVTGQSVHLEIAPEVRAALVAPILQTAEMELRGIPSIPNGRGVYWGDGKSGIVIFKRDAEFWLHCQGTNERRPYHFEYQRNESWMPAALAWDFYTLTKGIRP